jgi:glycosyltransferase involved in cell wall biosynthesis
MPFHSMGVPTVWGPIGGCEPFPWKYAFETSVLNWLFEGGRNLTDHLAKKKQSVLESLNEVDVIITTNRQTEDFLLSMGRKKPVLRQPMVISHERFKKIRESVTNKANDFLKIISGGSIEGRKGFALTIKALAKLKKMGIPFQFTVTGRGIEVQKLRNLANGLGLSREVSFETNLDSDSYIKKLAESHIFCFPSLRDNSPVTLIEAMAAGCVPIVLDNGGPSEAVNSNCGIILPLETPRETIEKILISLIRLNSNRDLLNSYSAKALEVVRERYLDDRIGKTMSNAYTLAIETHRSAVF